MLLYMCIENSENTHLLKGISLTVLFSIRADYIQNIQSGFYLVFTFNVKVCKKMVDETIDKIEIKKLSNLQSKSSD